MKVLQISISDFKDKMPPVLINELKHIALMKQFLKHIRMQKIVKAAVDLK